MPFASLVAHRDVSLLLYQIWWFHASPIVIILCLYAIAFVHPRLVLRIRRHPPVAARRQGNGADFHAVRHTVPLELLRPEAAIEIFQPFEDGFAAEIVLERNATQGEHLFRRISEANRIVEEEVVQRVRPDNILCLLEDISLFIRRQQLRADRCIKDALQAFAAG